MRCQVIPNSRCFRCKTCQVQLFWSSNMVACHTLHAEVMTHAEVVEVEGDGRVSLLSQNLSQSPEICRDVSWFSHFYPCVFSNRFRESVGVLVDPFSHFTRLLTELPGKSAQSVCFGSSKKSSSNLDIHNLPTQGIKSDWTELKRCQLDSISMCWSICWHSCLVVANHGKFGGIFHRGYLMWKSTQTEFWIRTVCRWPWATTRDQLSSNRMFTDRRAEGSGELWWFSSTECCQRYPKAKASSKW